MNPFLTLFESTIASAQSILNASCSFDISRLKMANVIAGLAAQLGLDTTEFKKGIERTHPTIFRGRKSSSSGFPMEV
jgi:hypothetical protein